VIHPNKRFNRLKKGRKVVCPDVNLPVIQNKLNELITMYYNYKVHHIQPWILRGNGKILVEDLNALEMLGQIDSDIQEQKRRAAESKRQLEEQNSQQKKYL
jgi:hypothetical protein